MIGRCAAVLSSGRFMVGFPKSRFKFRTYNYFLKLVAVGFVAAI
jgi:hypothetical protein